MTYDPRATSLPDGDMDIDPTGLSTCMDMSRLNVGLSQAETGLFVSTVGSITTVAPISNWLKWLAIGEVKQLRREYASIDCRWVPFSYIFRLKSRLWNSVF